jgi:hypothetical protein
MKHQLIPKVLRINYLILVIEKSRIRLKFLNKKSKRMKNKITPSHSTSINPISFDTAININRIIGNDTENIYSEIKPQIITLINEITPEENNTSKEKKAFGFKVRDVLDSPKITFRDNSYIPNFTNDYCIQMGVSTLNVNFNACYQDSRSKYFQISRYLCLLIFKHSWGISRYGYLSKILHNISFTN